MEGLHKGRTEAAWQAAVFQRTKKLKDLKHYTGPEKRPRPADVAAKMKHIFSTIKTAHAGGVK